MKINKYLIFFIVFLFGLIYWIGCPPGPGPSSQIRPEVYFDPDNDVFSGQEYTIKWYGGEYARKFRVEESKNSSFSSLSDYWEEEFAKTSIPSITISHYVNEETIYFYRVMSFSPNLEIWYDSAWSGTVSKKVVPIPPGPEIEVLPASLSFDIVTVSESSRKTFTIKNTGTAVLNVTSITAPDGFTVDKSTAFTVSANDSQVVTVTFSPTTAKSYSDNITINSDDSDEPQVFVSVSGTGEPVPVPEIEVVPASLSFGGVTVSESSRKTFTIKNTGTAVLNVTSITAPDGFTVDKSTSFTVSENDSQVVTVTFSPTDVKSYSDNITINSDDSDEPQVFVSVSGTGAPVPVPEIEVVPASLSFNTVTVSESSQKTFTIKNTGTAVLNISGITAPDGFTVDKSTSFTVSENDSQVVTVTFSPTAVKSYSGNITINSDDSDEPQVIVSLSGTGAPAPEIEVVPASLSFNTVTVYASSQKTFLIKNTGTAVLNITSITAPDGFTLYPSTDFTVPENSNRVVTVTFSPTAVESYSGNITINSDDQDEQQVFVSVSGIGVPATAPDIEVVPTSLSFGHVIVNQPSQMTFTIKNTGTAVLNVTSITAPEGFTVDKSTAFTVSANDSKVVTVTFSPAGDISYSNNITINSDDSNEPQVIVSVSGIGSLD